MNSSAVTEGNEVTVQDESMLTIGFVDDGGNPTTNTTNIALQPTADGVFNSGNVNVNVDTNSPLGYTLTMSASTSSLSRSEAVGNMTPVIPTLTTAVAQADFPNNYWGYKRTTSTLDGATEQIADTLYQPMRENYNIPISSTGVSASKSISTVNFGVKLDTNTPSGNYNININFLAVSNVAPYLAYMQDATSTSLAAAMPSVGDTTVLYDRRDNKEYTIAKLADGKYWMTKNLDLDGGTPLYSSDSDVPAGYDAEPYYTLPASSESGFDNNTKAYMYNSPNKTDSCSSGCYSYYSFNAATAMSAKNVASNNTDAPYSICPKNWKLPTTRTSAPNNSDFYQLAVAYGMSSADISQDTPNFYNQAGPGTTANFILSGNYYSSSFHSGGGEYWSSTTVDNQYMAVVMSFTNNIIYSYIRQERKTGSAVRCLFDATMQNFVSEDADAMALHQEEVLVDARDGKNYYVTKLKDGNVWMTQNLDFDITGETLTSADTDLVDFNDGTNTTTANAAYTTANGYSKSGDIISWTPASTAITIHTGRDKTNPTNGDINYDTNAGKWANSNKYPYSVDPGDWYQTGTYFSSSVCHDVSWSTGCNFLNSALNNAYNGQSYGQPLTIYFRQTPYTDNGTHGAVGNWYNWSAAVAANDTSTLSTGDTTVNNSVCPAGWGLPANGKYDALNTIYNSNAASGALDAGLFAAPLYFVRGGVIYTQGTTTLLNAGRVGFYWSGTTYLADASYSLYFRSSNVNPARGDYRGIGYSVRCLLRTE